MTNSAVIKSFSYKPKKTIMLLSSALFGPIAWVFIHLAQTNDRGLNIVISRGLFEIPLDPHQTTIFYWVSCVLSLCFAIFGLFGIYKAFTSKAEIGLTEEAITIPKGMFSKTKSITIPYKNITSMNSYSVNRTRMLHIKHTQGQVDVIESMLPKKSQLNEIIEFIENKIKDKH